MKNAATKGVLASVLLSLAARAGAFVVPCSSGARDASCVPATGLDGQRGSGGVARVEPRDQLTCRGGRQETQEALFSSRRGHQRSQQRWRRRQECPITTAVFPASATATTRGASSAIMNAQSNGCDTNGEAGEEDEIPRPQPRHRPRAQGGGQQQSRADFLRCGASVAGVAAVVLGGQQQAARAIDLGGVEFGFKNKNVFNIPDEDNPDGLRSPRPLAYRVEYTDPPTTVPFPREFEPNLVKEMAGHRMIFFGVHGEDARDQVTTAEVIGKISTKLKDKAAIGLEQVEMQFQPALDAYVAGGQEGQGGQEDLDRADAELAEAIQWDERCAFPFDNFRPVFHLARSRGLPLLAMGVDSEKVFDVMQNGMDSLGADERNTYVSDFKGFVTYVRDKGFQAYADKLIFPSYDRLSEAGLLGKKPPTKPNFFAARILADEALASKAVDWVTQNKGKKLFVVQREDHVKFGFGASGRAARIAESLGSEMSTRSILINPTAEDSLSLSRSLRLALEYADDLENGKPLANYLWFTKSPKVNQIPRMVNPENKGWLESINLYDFKGAAPG